MRPPTLDALKTALCQPLEGHAPLSPEAVAQHLALVPGWHLNGDAIEKTFQWRDFHQTMAFVNHVAYLAHRHDHHPDMQVSYNRCVLRFNTHSVGGLSVNDFICAAQANQAAEGLPL